MRRSLSSEIEREGAAGVVRTVAANIRAVRRESGMTRAELAAAAGLGKSTLAQLESGRANPSVETLWAIAAALRVPFGRIVEEHRPATRVVRAAEVQPVRSEESAGFTGRLLTAAQRRGTFELYAIDVGAGEVRHAAPPHAGVVEHLLVVSGRLRVGPADAPEELGAGDLVTFAADVPHLYEAREDVHAVLLMSYP